MDCTPPPRHALLFRLAGTYNPPNRHALRLRIDPDAVTVATAQGQTTDASGRYRPPLRRLLFAQTGLRHSLGSPLGLQSDLPWRDGTELVATASVTIRPGSAVDVATDLPWQQTTAFETQRSLPIGRATPRDGQRISLPTRNPAGHDVQRFSRWQQATARDGHRIGLPWRNPASHDQQRSLVSRQAAPRDHQVWLATGKARRRDVGCVLPWGVATPVPWAFELEVPFQPQPPAPLACYYPQQRHALRLALQRGALYLPPPRHTLPLVLRCGLDRRVDLRSTLHMSHTLNVVRLPDRLPLAVRSVSLAADRDSWAWTAQIGFATAASLLAVEPTPEGMVSVEINLDGHVFVAEVEGYTEDRSHNRRGGSVTARSRTVQLASPAAPERAYISPAPATAQQLALREIEFTGFALDWQIADWPVPAGAWAYERETPISAITRIANAAGAMLQSAPASDTLIVAPRYPALPWLLGAATPDFTLAGGSWLRKGKRYSAGSGYNGVYVSGREQGVLANIYRDGTNGSPYAELVVDALITDTAPAIGLGGSILAASLPRHEIPVELPLTPANAAPGLLLPGELGQIEDVVWGHYRAVVDSVQLSAEVDDSGLVTARQSASLWRYLP